MPPARFIGLGGGTLPTAFSRILPQAEIDNVEIDPAVVRVARKYCNFRPTAKNKVVEEDGRVIILKHDGLPSSGNIKKNARQLEKRIKPLGVDSSFLLPLFSTKRDWRPDARILTDQYSPSNLLNASRR
jgi:hypothetical protein